MTKIAKTFIESIEDDISQIEKSIDSLVACSRPSANGNDLSYSISEHEEFLRSIISDIRFKIHIYK